MMTESCPDGRYSDASSAPAVPGRVLVAMSGGVDSSVAASLLQADGWDCVGVTMKLFGPDSLGVDPEHPCCTERDIADAAAVCRKLGIPHHLLSFGEDFAAYVMDYFVRSYEAGETPNPCVLCNRHLKFGRLLREAERLGCTHIATGHYARCRRETDGHFSLRKAVDPGKDQSYVLHGLTQAELARCLFPIGELHKSDVRRLAEEVGFGLNAKKESQDICFIPDGNYLAFLERYRGKAYPPARICDQSGHTLKEEGRAAVSYTIGQRKGLSIAAKDALFVLRKDMASNTVTVGPSEALYTSRVQIRACNWCDGEVQEGSLMAAAKLRYSQREAPCRVEILNGGETCQLNFQTPQRAVTPGQFAVLYDGDRVLGGGRIVS